MGESFTSIPVLHYDLITSGHKDEFVKQLQHALIHVGFLYLSNPPVDRKSIDTVIEYAPKLFDLPQEQKNAVQMLNSQHFLGYSRLGSELTKGAIDQREQYDFATQHDCQWQPGDPEFLKLWGEAQWPSEDVLPGFKNAFLAYLEQVEALSYQFIDLMAEAFGLKPEALQQFFDGPEVMQHRAKVIKYPPRSDVSSDQGVGPHFDSGFLTFLLQASSHTGLQVQNISAEWIDVPPIAGTLVVNIGKGLEAVTQNLAKATSHRVLSPAVGSTARYSIPFFQNISQTVKLSEHVPQFPQEILKLKDQRKERGMTDSVNYGEYDREPAGQVALIGRVKSHPDVAQRHYPNLFKQFFPNGLPVQGYAY